MEGNKKKCEFFGWFYVLFLVGVIGVGEYGCRRSQLSEERRKEEAALRAAIESAMDAAVPDITWFLSGLLVGETYAKEHPLRSKEEADGYLRDDIAQGMPGLTVGLPFNSRARERYVAGFRFALTRSEAEVARETERLLDLREGVRVMCSNQVMSARVPKRERP